MKELKLKISLDRSDAIAEAARFNADQKKLVKAAQSEELAGALASDQAARKSGEARVKQAAEVREARTKAAKEALGASVAADSAESASATRTSSAKISAASAFRDASGRFTKQRIADEATAATASVAAHGKSKASGLELFTALSTGFTAVQSAIGQASALLGGFSKAIDDAASKSAKLGSDFNARRETLGQLAALKGEKPDNAFVLKQAQFAARTGLRPEEATAVQTAYLNAAAQFVGEDLTPEETGRYQAISAKPKERRTEAEAADLAGLHGKAKQLSKTQSERLQAQVGNYAAAKGLDPATVADLAGRAIGFKDYNQFPKAAEAVMADLNASMSLISSGGGMEAQVGSEAVKLAGSSVSEDATRGIFKSIKDAAKLVSVLTESFKEGQAEAGQAALRGLRGFEKKKGGAFIKAAGVGLTDDPFLAIKKVGEHAEKMAAKGPAGTTSADVIRENFDDELAARAITSLYNQGEKAGLFKAREQVAQENATPDKAQRIIDEYKVSERGVSRTRDAQQLLVEAERGAKTSKIDILRKEALTQLTKSGLIDTTDANIKKYIAEKASFGVLGDVDRQRIDERVGGILAERSGKRGQKRAALPFRTEDREDLFNQQIQAIEKTGRSAITDRALPPPLPEPAPLQKAEGVRPALAQLAPLPPVAPDQAVGIAPIPKGARPVPGVAPVKAEGGAPPFLAAPGPLRVDAGEVGIPPAAIGRPMLDVPALPDLAGVFAGPSLASLAGPQVGGPGADPAAFAAAIAAALLPGLEPLKSIDQKVTPRPPKPAAPNPRPLVGRPPQIGRA